MKAMIGALFGLAIVVSADAQPDGLRFALGLSKPTFLPGEHVFATVTLRNDSQVPLACIYPHSDTGLSIRDVSRDREVSRQCGILCGIAVFAGCVLEPGAEHLEVIVLTECHGEPDSVPVGIPDARYYHALLPGRYEASARYSVPSVRDRKGYVLRSNVIGFEVREPSLDLSSQIWRRLSHFEGNTPEYRDTLSVLVEENPYDPFVASLYLDSSLLDRSETRHDSAMRMVSRRPNSDLAGFIMMWLAIWEARGDMEWPAGFLDDLYDRYPESLATRVAHSGIKYWECYNASGLRDWRDP